MTSPRQHTDLATMAHLVDEYLAGIPRLDHEAARVAVALWRHLAEGAPVAVTTWRSGSVSRERASTQCAGCSWRHGDSSPRHARREQLKVEIRRLFAKHRGTYGSPRITADLREEGWRVSENTVAAIVRDPGYRPDDNDSGSRPPARARAGGGHRI